jgi:serine/threonine-protein kinase
MSPEQKQLNRALLTPTGVAVSAEGMSSLPPELLKEASVRVGWAGMLYASAYSLAYFGPLLANWSTHPELRGARPEHFVATGSILMGVVVFLLSRYSQWPAARLLDLGLVFAVVGALGISMAEFWTGFPARTSFREFLGIPWECVWILIVPLVAPNLPRKILITSLLEASTPIVVLWLVTLSGRPLEVPVITLAVYFLCTTYLCAVLAYVISGHILRYGVRLGKAREIGSYSLVRRLGEGGMGEVWIAAHRMLARPAAMKLIRPELLGADVRSRETAIARFEREAKATAALGSTHTVSVYDFGLTDQGSFFYVMELLDGLSLDALVKRFGPVRPARAVYLLRQGCHSLGEAHGAGLIHRDIKPANIFVCRLGPDYDFVKVLDFGLVKHFDHEPITQVTAEGTAAGTPAYMSPEIALGKPDVDGRADIYALGCVAYFMLTGEPVFSGPTPMATVLAHVQSTPVPPAQRSELKIPETLSDAVLACLAKNPADRPATARDLDRLLAASLAGVGWTNDQARDWWERNLGRGADLHP